MSFKTICDEIASHYATADCFGSIKQSHRSAVAQIRREHLGSKPHYKVLDLGIGNGAFIKELQHFLPLADFTGIDISSKMLQYARKILSITMIEGSATDASHFLPNHSQDLVLAHFINAYIPIHTLFKEANLLTPAEGYFSLITTTYESFPVAQQYLAEFIGKGNLLSTVVGHYYKAITKNSTVFSGLDELMHSFPQNQFKVKRHERLYIPINLNNVDDLVRFAMEGTWFLNSLTIRMLPKKFLITRLSRLFSEIFTFPYHDTHIIDVVLAKKA